MARLPKFLNMSAAGRVRLALPTARLAIIAFSFTLAAVGMGAFVATLPSAPAAGAADAAAASPDAASGNGEQPGSTPQDDAAQDAAPAEEGDVASGDASAAAGSYSAPGGTLVAPVSSGFGAAAPSGTSSSSGAAVDYVLAREARLAGPRVYTPASSALADPAPGEKDLPRERPVPSLGLLRVADGYVTGSIWWVDPAGEGCVVGSLATGVADLTDVQADVSSRHLRVWREGDAWWAMDLGSTNGSWLTPAGGERVRLEPGVRREVGPADELALGAGTSFVLVEGLPG